MSLHTWCHKPGSCDTFMLNPHWGRAAIGQEKKKKKKRLMSIHVGSLRSCPALCDPIDCGLPGFFVQERILEVYWPILVAIPF